ncbi:TonB-dependent receptor [Termitidicoccus mucosus]|uniref:TonB-dependent receptor n=1 Tax=Termitidicoccus mucosus TaxID=1184151 RepID=A0A178ICR6_9BACT|nr:hypothetical protein AW736_22855 [Opitutaceae bacterium TSB47]
MKQKITLTGWLLLAGAFMTGNLRAAEIRGTVRDAKTGYFLEAVEISMNNGARSLLTDREGRFELTGLSDGEYKLTFIYPGMRTHSEQVSIAGADPSKTLNIALASLETDEQVVMLEKFTVAGVKEGQAASMARQKAADNVQVIISMDAHGDVADGNIGNFLQRLAGVTVTKDAGDIVNVTLRGSPAGSSAVSMDGNQMPTQNDRSVRVDYIPSEFIKEIEVIKGATPDMWADGLTGTVNLITKSAFDYRTAVSNYSAGASVNTYRSDLWEIGPFAQFTYMNAFGDKRNLGVSMSASYNKSIRPSDRTQTQRRELDGRLTQARLLDDIVFRKRSGVSTKVEYRPSKTLSIKFNGSWNQYKQLNTRNAFDATSDGGSRTVADYTRVGREEIEGGAVPRDENNNVAGVAPGFTDTYTEILNALVGHTARVADSTTDVYRYGIELSKRLNGGAKLDFGISTTHTDAVGYNRSFLVRRRGGIGIGIDTSTDIKKPQFIQTYGPSYEYGTDYSTGWTATFSGGDNNSSATINVLTADLTKDMILCGMPLRLKTGFAMRLQDRDSFAMSPAWRYTGDIPHLKKPGQAYGLFNGFYAGKDQFDIYKVMSEYADPVTNSDFTVTSNVRPPHGKITEDVYAGYVMSSLKIRRLLITGGIRGEWTDINASGSISNPRALDQVVVGSSSDYMEAFPSVHLKYSVWQNLIARASWHTSMARPAIDRIVPATTITYPADEAGEGRITENNTGLKPQYAKNWDLALEYYLRSSGIISIGWFRKNITNFITSTSWLETEGEWAGFNRRTWINVGSAELEGYEMEYSQRLAFLPKPFNGISVFANYTHIKTKGEYNDGIEELAKFIPRSYNAGLTWRWWKLEGRVQYRYQSGFLSEYSTDPTQKIKLTADDTLDVNIKFNIKRWLTVYADFQNILNEAPYYYNINKRRVTISQATGTQLTLGVSGRF